MDRKRERKGPPSVPLELDQGNMGKQAWIRKAMKDRRSEWTEAKKLTVFCGTWNVNAKKPGEDISSWLMPPASRGKLPDIYCLGFQEVVDLNAQNLLVDHSVSKDWERHIESSKLGQKVFGSEYVLKQSTHLVGLLMVVYVRKSLSALVRDVDSEVCGVGILGMGGNKGAVAVRMGIYDTTIAFVNSHLAAHKNNVQGRNSDFHNICKRVRFKSRSAEERIGSQNYTFWIGDLNYRLTTSDLAEVFRDIENGNISGLLKHDQLLIEKSKQSAFQGYTEGPITFLPTYKYVTGTDRYDREGKKIRMPAWCDRIQWTVDKEVKGTQVKQLFYQRSEQKSSDHKPVMACFDVTAQKVVEEAKKRVFQNITRQFDEWENNQIPQVALSRNNVNFVDVQYATPQTQVILIENVGKSVAEYYFASGAGDGSQSASRGWLSVNPYTGYIPPGHKINLQITVNVSGRTAEALNQGRDKLESMLIFRLKCGREDDLGKDYYITINGVYLRSCFGSSLEYLVGTPQPVRQAGPAGAKAKPDQVLTLPKELWRLADAIYKQGINEEDIFLTSGDRKQVASIREALDTGKDFGDIDVHSMAEALIQFMVSLSGPVFPLELVNELKPEATSPEALNDFCKQALLKLTPVHYNAFIYVVSFVQEVLKHKSSNKLTADKLVPLFAKCLFHYTPGPAEKILPHSKQKPYRVLKHYLTYTGFVEN